MLQKHAGNQHVIKVANELKHFLLHHKYTESIAKVTKVTCDKLLQKYPIIKNVETKFDQVHPDHSSDLMITLSNSEKRSINLFLIEGNKNIQPKNIGAQSFLSKYFSAVHLQDQFNIFLNGKLRSFYLLLLQQIELKADYLSISELRKQVREKNPLNRSHVENDSLRKDFLYTIRDYAFDLLIKAHNRKKITVIKAFSELLLTDSTNIITRYYKNNSNISVEFFSVTTPKSIDKLELYKKGNNGIAISSPKGTLIIRFKFESAKNYSSIKLASSFMQTPFAESYKEYNRNSIQFVTNKLKNHMKQSNANKSNAIGKCNEALFCYQVLLLNDEIKRIEKDSENDKIIEMINKYSPRVSQKELNQINRANSDAVKKLMNYLSSRYNQFQIEGIELIPESYIKDRLDNSDVSITIYANEKYNEEHFSLKAVKDDKSALTTKNPGAGTFLSDQYFGIEDKDKTRDFIKETKEEYLIGTLNHQKALERISSYFGEKLKHATQIQLVKGLQALLGNHPVIVSYYILENSKLFESGKISSKVNVKEKFPSSIQNTLFWNEGKEQLALRVKFSSAQSKGWTSIKLAAQYAPGKYIHEIKKRK